MNSRVDVRFASPEPALLIGGASASKRTLCISDLHIGYEKELAAKGFTIPSQTQKMTERLLSLVEKWDVDNVCLLGDVKHAVSEMPMAEWAEVPSFFENVSKNVSRVDVFPGNHDGGLRELTPRSVVFHPVAGGTVFGNQVALQHGHAWPSAAMLGCEYFILGHHHPVIELEDSTRNLVRLTVWLLGTWDSDEVRRRMEEHLSRIGRKTDGLRVGKAKILILPAFNTLVPGRVVNLQSWKPTSPLLKSGGVSSDETHVFTLDGTFIDYLSKLKLSPARRIPQGRPVD